MTAKSLVSLFNQSRSQRVSASELLGVTDATAAFILNRAVWIFGSFVENETTRFQHASKSTGKKGETSTPKDGEVAEYRRALIEGTPYSRSRARRKRVTSLSQLAKGRAGGRKIVQRPGERMVVE